MPRKQISLLSVLIVATIMDTFAESARAADEQQGPLIDEKAVEKILFKNNGLSILHTVREKLTQIEPFAAEPIEQMLRGLAEQKTLGLGKIAQPVRVAICGTTISPPIFDSLEMLGAKDAITRIDLALKKFEKH